MNVSKSFIDDMKYLRTYYDWSDEDAKEVREAIKFGGEPLVRYFTVLASAHRAGYNQGAANGFVRLREWCLGRGLPDPYSAEIDPKQLDMRAPDPIKIVY